MTGQPFMVADQTIGELLRADYRLVTPWYQRPYSWTQDKAEQLLDDLLRATEPAGEVSELDPYFLGSLVTVRPAAASYAELIDGQQRLATLTILMCAARAYVSEQFAESLTTRIFQPSDPILGTAFQPRLALRERDQSFFQTHVLDLDGMARVRTLGLDNLTLSQRRLIHNTTALLDRLAVLPRETCERLIKFIDSGLHVIVVTAADTAAAFRVFNTLNDRGQNLTHADILKGEIVGGLPPDLREKYTQKWEQEEEDLGADFSSLFSHLRFVHTRGRARGTIIDDFRSAVLPAYPDRQTFIDACLIPYSDGLQTILRAQYGDGAPDSDINILLRWLSITGNSDWVPCALTYLLRPETNAETFARFLRDLERLAASMLIRKYDDSRRQTRYGRVLGEIEAGSDLFDPRSELQLKRDECDAVLRILDSGFEGNYAGRKYVLLRLDATLVNGVVTYLNPGLSVEHVLPRSPLPHSEWTRWFPDPARRRMWTDRLANLVLISTAPNKAAGRLEFAAKKDKYFTTRHGVSQSALTTMVLQEQEWTPTILDRRQKLLVGKLIGLWRLK